MNPEEPLILCSICKHQKQDENQSLFCGLNSPANFGNFCPSFVENTEKAHAPEAAITESGLEMNLAGKGKRLANYVLDIVFFMIHSYLLGIIIGVIFIIAGQNGSSLIKEENKLRDYFMGFISVMIYYILLEATTGRTLGKFITGTKVVTDKGEKPGFMTIFIRSLCRFIPFEAFTFLISDSFGLHDRLSKTRVINSKSAPKPVNETPC
jgi:uncharacterized RDD family membrane protein YckC